MRNLYFLLIFTLVANNLLAQSIQVDAVTYTSQQLVEDVLINSGCIQNIQVNNTVSGNFGGSEKSFGYFNANGSGFPFESGIVMSTGKLSNVPGPNSYLSDDDATGWTGDQDLEQAIGINNTTNATIIEFDFTPNADNISFRYLFASEEYQEGSPNTCIYSDAFAFLIKPVGGVYTNIALVPGTNTPVLVTTVHSGINGSCPPINAGYFEGYNGTNVPINFNGQTKILTAQTAVTPNQPYHIKLVIADEQNYRFDSAVFLEAESFNISANLGIDRTLATQNPLCENETYVLDATPATNPPLSYAWFKDGVLLPAETGPQITVSTAGEYSVSLDYGGGCVATDSIVIEYTTDPTVQNVELFQCEPMADGIAIFNLNDAIPNITIGDSTLRSGGFYTSLIDAQNGVNPIQNPTNYTNTVADEVVFVRISSEFGCTSIATITLKTTTNTLPPYYLVECSNSATNQFADFDLSEATLAINTDLGGNFIIQYFTEYDDAIAVENTLPTDFTNTESNFQILFIRISGDEGCVGISTLELTVLPTPQLDDPINYTYCLDRFPETITLISGVLGNPDDYTYLWSTGETTSTIEINAAATYTVTITQTTQANGTDYDCSIINTITVSPSELATFTYEITGVYGNQNIIITSIGIGDYVYAIDDENGFYQESPIFENVRGGVHILYVKDKNGCGIASQQIFILDFPKFFTPNNDGYHDYWQILGLNSDELQITNIEIFDRFSILMKELKPTSRGWDGTFKGKLLTSSDYWFIAYFSDGSEYRSHFTLKR